MEAAAPPRESRPGRDWDRITAIAAVLIGLAAVLVSVYTVLLQREQVRAEVWPRLDFYYAGVDGEFRVSNKGIGPAIIETVEVSIDGVPVRDWAEVTARLGLSDPGQLYSSLWGAVLSPGEHLAYLIPSGQEAFAQIRAETQRISMTVCYCSALRDCWLAAPEDDGQVEVDACPVLPPERRFQN
ncbi:hypothetical protein [Arenimonas composti]|uniref:Uncharacterized protein n=1 Tax=Arenimonas composti TR7-09 = DSM 18010 TaxID=1121013 RepID=A0A091BD63_9GAMM|nr:hypothetical protein [Arenimonas composti]KFN49686.1 hypothetical protein P873_09975 [Arenimonas composti TR7-09 = DSM 18010]